MSGRGKGPEKESDKVRILVGVLGTLRGGYDRLQRAGSVLCGSETEQFLGLERVPPEPAGNLSGGTKLTCGACRGHPPVGHPRFGGYQP